MRLTEQVHLKLMEVIRSGDTVIDATAGNGHDALALAKLVGPSGKVIIIDVQTAAIEATRDRLMEAKELAQCELIEGDHAEVLHELLEQHRESVRAITFNLGYLPGAEKTLTTKPETTVRALDAAISLLRPGGILLVTAYRGHAGGMSEAQEVEKWMLSLRSDEWDTFSTEPDIKSSENVPPILWTAFRAQ